MRRRDVLSAVAGFTGAAGFAGCLGVPGGSAGTPATDTATPGTPAPGASPTPEPTDSGDAAPTPSEVTFEVTDRACGGGENAASVSFDGETVAVDGVIGGRDSCDTARLASAGLHHDVLTVVVEVTEEPHTATAACAQCLTDIAYAFSATVEGGGPARVRVVHRTADGESTVTTADRP